MKRADINVLSKLDDSAYDKEYAVFVCKMLELQQYIDEELGLYESPRKLDSFLLSNLTVDKNADSNMSKFDDMGMTNPLVLMCLRLFGILGEFKLKD